MFLFIFLLLFTGCVQKNLNYNYNYVYKPTKSATQKPYVVKGKKYYPLKRVPLGWTQRGIASWYGPNFHGRYTSNGEIYNMYAYTAAHKTLPMNTIVKVTNLINKKSVIVRINDRGPFVKDRIIDLSYVAGKKIGLDVMGTAPVELKVIGFNGKKYLQGYNVQVGAYIDKKKAIKKQKFFKNLGYNTRIIKEGIFYKILIGPFSSYKKAKRFMLRYKISGFIIGE